MINIGGLKVKIVEVPSGLAGTSMHTFSISSERSEKPAMFDIRLDDTERQKMVSLPHGLEMLLGLSDYASYKRVIDEHEVHTVKWVAPGTDELQDAYIQKAAMVGLARARHRKENEDEN